MSPDISSIKAPRIITATGTPLNEDQSLHVEGLRVHLEDQLANRIDGFLVAGTMGMMQMLSEQVYKDVVTQSVAITRGRGEILVGCGDNSLARSLDKVRFCNDQKIDGVAILAPTWVAWSQAEMIDYCNAIADASKHPVFLYDNPYVARMKIDFDTTVAIARHPNVKGIKCSDHPGYARQVFDAVGDKFRVIIAAPDLVDTFIRHGIYEHLDGIYCLCPQWIRAVADHSAKGEWDKAAEYQGKVSTILRLLRKNPVLAMFTWVLNARGIPGSFAPKPFRPLTDDQIASLKKEAIIQELLAE